MLNSAYFHNICGGEGGWGGGREQSEIKYGQLEIENN